MNKTKIGITEFSYAALTFLAGLGGLIPVLLLAGAAFVMNESDWLKKTVFRAVAFMLFMMVVHIALMVVNGGLESLNTLYQTLFGRGTNLMIPANFYRMLGNLINLLQYIGLFVFAAQAWRGKAIHLPFIDGMVNKCV